MSPSLRRCWRRGAAITFLLLFTLLLLIDDCSGQQQYQQEQQEQEQQERVYKMNVALHAQAEPSPHMIVGSVLTTNGLKAALNTMKQRSASTDSSLSQSSPGLVTTFYPFGYAKLYNSGCWDVVIIEGYFFMISAFIHEARRANLITRTQQIQDAQKNGNFNEANSAEHSFCESPIVLFWNLDPDVPGVESLQFLDVDGFMTNSASVQKSLLHTGHNHVRLIPLAADVNEFYYQSPQHEEEVDAAVSPHKKKKKHEIVFVGTAGGIIASTKIHLASILRAVLLAANENENEDETQIELVIYGSGWNEVPEFRKYWRGVLPMTDLRAVYSGALAVLGVTMDSQREEGMINNRVFEVLACETILISDRFTDEARESLGLSEGDRSSNAIRFFDDATEIPGIITSIIYENLNNGGREKRESTKAARDVITAKHTYASRVVEMLAFADEIKNDRRKVQDYLSSNSNHIAARESNKMRVGIVLSNIPRPESADDENALDSIEKNATPKPSKAATFTTLEELVKTNPYIGIMFGDSLLNHLSPSLYTFDVISTAHNESEWWIQYDFLLGVGNANGDADKWFANNDGDSANSNAWPKAWRTARGISQIRMFLLGEGKREGIVGDYDVIFTSPAAAAATTTANGTFN
jgi:spore maturation protein CgeB